MYHVKNKNHSFVGRGLSSVLYLEKNLINGTGSRAGNLCHI